MPKAKALCKMMCCTVTEAAVEKIRADLTRYRPGLWAEENNLVPACHCGLRGAKEPCTRHGRSR